MTEYTETKRALQALGFRLISRKGEKDIVLGKDDVRIRLVDDPDTAALTYAATKNNVPVSWHKGSPRCHEPGEYLGLNYHIQVKPESELTNEEYALFLIMGNIAHKGQWFTDLNAEW